MCIRIRTTSSDNHQPIQYMQSESPRTSPSTKPLTTTSTPAQQCNDAQRAPLLPRRRVNDTRAPGKNKDCKYNPQAAQRRPSNRTGATHQRFQRHLHRLPVAASGHGYVLGGLAECQMSTNRQRRQQAPLRGGNLHEQCKKPRAVSNTGQSIKTKPIKPIRNPENAAAATTPAMTALRVTTRACWSTINDSRLDKCRVPRSIGESLESNN